MTRDARDPSPLHEADARAVDAVLSPTDAGGADAERTARVRAVLARLDAYPDRLGAHAGSPDLVQRTLARIADHDARAAEPAVIGHVGGGLRHLVGLAAALLLGAGLAIPVLRAIEGPEATAPEGATATNTVDRSLEGPVQVPLDEVRASLLSLLDRGQSSAQEAWTTETPEPTLPASGWLVVAPDGRVLGVVPGPVSSRPPATSGAASRWHRWLQARD